MFVFKNCFWMIFFLMILHGGFCQPADEAQAKAYFQEGNSYYEKKDYTNALTLWEKSLQIYQAIYKDTPHPEIANLLHRVGIAYYLFEKYDKALQYYQASLRMKYALYGKDKPHIETIKTLRNLAILYSDLSQWPQCFQYVQASLDMCYQLHGKDTPHSDTANAIVLAASLYQDAGQYEQALEYYEAYIKMAKSLYGNKPDSKLAEAMYQAGVLYVEFEQNQKALASHQASLEMKYELFGKDQPNEAIARSLNSLGLTYFQLGQHQKALQYEQASIEMLYQLGGKEQHAKSISSALRTMGLSYIQLKQHQKALESYQVSLEMASYGVGKDQPDEYVAFSLAGVGLAYTELKEYHKALQYLQASLDMFDKLYGKGTPSLAVALAHQQMGKVYQLLNQYPQALEHYSVCLKMFYKLSRGKPQPIMGSVLYEIAQTYLASGEYQKALEYHQANLAIQYQVGGKNQPNEKMVQSLNLIGFIYRELGQPQKAVEYHYASLELQYRLVGKQQPDAIIANILGNLGSAYLDLGQWQKALEYAQAGLDMAYKVYGKDTTRAEIAAYLVILGHIYQSVEQLPQAFDCHHKAEAIYVQLYGRNTPSNDMITILTSLGNTHRRLGQLQKAFEYQQASLAMAYQLYGPNACNDDVAGPLSALAGYYISLRKLPEALEYEQRCLAIYQKLYGKETPHPKTVITLNSLGMIYNELGEHTKALEYLKSGLVMCEQLYGKDKPHPLVVQSLTNIGDVYMQLAKFQDASDTYKDGLKMCVELYGQNMPHPKTMQLIRQIAMLDIMVGDYKQALDSYEMTVKMSYELYGQSNMSDHGIVSSLNRIAWISLLTKDYTKAWESSSRSAAISSKLFRTYASATTAQDTSRSWKYYLAPVSGLQLTLLCCKPSKKKITEVYETVLANKSIIRRGLLLNKQILADMKDPALLQLYQEYQSGLQQLANLSFAWKDAKDFEQNKARYNALIQQCQKQEELLNQKCSAFREIQQFPDVKLSQIQKKISKDTAVLEFFVFYHGIEKKEWTGAFVLTSKQIQFVDLGTADQIQKATEDLLSSIRKDMRELTQPGMWDHNGLTPKAKSYLQQQEAVIQKKSLALSELVFAPLAKHCKKARQLVIAPDSFLHFLPYGILTQKQANRLSYLVEQYDIVYCFGGDSLLKNTKALPSSMTFYGIDSPDFNLSLKEQQTLLKAMPQGSKNLKLRGSHAGQKKIFWPLLRGEEEIECAKQKVQAFCPQATMVIHSGKQALEPYVKQQFPQSHWVHIVTHGFFFETEKEADDDITKNWVTATANPFMLGQAEEQKYPLLLSGIVLAGANVHPSVDQTFAQPGLASDSTGAAQQHRTSKTGADQQEVAPSDDELEDGYLTSHEIALMKLDRVHCAIFSCCGTGLGKADQSLGMSGLKWALEYAGVQNTILTLWDISKLSSPILDDLYTYTLDGEIPIPRAINMIQRKHAQSGTYLSHPGLWGAFICNGLPELGK